MGNRKSFDKLPFLGIEYGINNSMIHTHWFDAESQLESYCKEHNVSLFNSNLLIEEDSLYKYQNKNYFNDSGELLNNDTFFFICRKGET
jgi:hypothetical protein